MVKAIRRAWNRLEDFLLVLQFSLLLVTVFVQIVSRVVFNFPMVFTEELARYLFLWTTFLGFSYVTKKETNLSMGILRGRLSGKARTLFDLCSELFGLATCAFVLYWSIQYIGFSMIDLAPAMEIPMGLVYLCMPIGMGLAVIRYVGLLVRDIRRLIV